MTDATLLDALLAVAAELQRRGLSHTVRTALVACAATAEAHSPAGKRVLASLLSSATEAAAVRAGGGGRPWTRSTTETRRGESRSGG